MMLLCVFIQDGRDIMERDRKIEGKSAGDFYDKEVLYQIIEDAPKELKLQLLYNPLDEKPYCMIGSNPFTSTIKAMKDISSHDFSEDQLRFNIDKHYTNMALHNHEFFEYIHITSGKIETKIDGDLLILEPGDICILNKKAVHYIKTNGDGNLSYNGIIMDAFRQRILAMMPENHPLTSFFNEQPIGGKNYVHFKAHDYEKLLRLSYHMIEEYYMDKPESSMAVTGYFTILLTELMRLYPYMKEGQVLQQEDDASIHKIIRYIQQNYQHATINMVSDHFHFNASYLSRYIKKETGKSFTHILKDIRIDKAKILLEHSRRSVEEIAYEVGYSSASHFYKVFRENVGITPVAYKESCYSD